MSYHILLVFALVAYKQLCAQTQYMVEQEPIRRALVIGNPSYRSLPPLPNARIDADQVKARLEELGFIVDRDSLVSVRDFEDRILPAFRSKVRAGDIVAFYYSGHGFAYGPHNFLAPADLSLTLDNKDVGLKAVAVEGVEEYLGRATPGIIVTLIDACRSVPGFQILDRDNKNVMSKSVGLHEQRLTLNTLVGYATRPGAPALASTLDSALSPFTKSLIARIGVPGDEFVTTYRYVISDVRRETNDRQDPGLVIASEAALYLTTTADVREREKQAWISALNSGRPADIEQFGRLYSVSRYAASARQWLAQNADKAEAPQFTRLSPAAVEGAWRPDGNRAFVTQPALPLAFARSIDLQRAEGVGQLDRSTLGIGETESNAVRRTSEKITRDLQSIMAHQYAVTISPLSARSAPSSTARIISTLPGGTALVVHGIATVGTTWIQATAPGIERPIYVMPTMSEVPFEQVDLGLALREVLVKPLVPGSDLADSSAVLAAVALLKREGRTVFWVSLSTGVSDEPREAEARAGRRAHVEYLLKRAGIDGRRITAVGSAPGITGDDVRLRFFGY